MIRVQFIKNQILNKDGKIFYFILIPLVLLLIAGITLWIVILKLRSPAGKGLLKLAPPINIVWSMYESAARGDSKGYIDCFAEEAQGAIRETLQSKGEDAFIAYLKDISSGIMGISILKTDETTLATAQNQIQDTTSSSQSGENIITIPVEIVFKGSNKRQVFTLLKRAGDSWKILNVSTPVFTPQLIPYGENLNK